MYHPKKTKKINRNLNEFSKNSKNSKNIRTIEPKHSLKGGKMLGEGSFGCVVTPPIKCHKININKFRNKKYVSKIVHSEGSDEDIIDEIEIGKVIFSLDKAGKYFTPIIKSCYLGDEIRSNTMQVELIPDSDEYYVLRNDYPKIKDSNKCKIDYTKYPYNLILKNAGGDIHDAIKKSTNSLENRYLRKNMRSVVKHLCTAVKKLHDNYLIQRDIKPENISFKIDNKKKIAKITLFDFGLTNHFNKDVILDNIQYISSGGTMVYKPPETNIIGNITKELNRSHGFLNASTKLRDRRFILKILEQAKNKYNKHDNSHNIYRKLQRGGITNIKSFKNKTKIKKSDFYIPTKDDLIIYKNVLYLIEKNLLLNEFYKRHGILCKWDVYSLGMSLLEIIKEIRYYDKECIDLINNMINIDFTKRYNINMCLRHKYLNPKKVRKKGNNIKII